jgi:chromosome segregation ATPase
VQLQAAVHELQARLKESVRERERLVQAHASQLSALSAQIAAKLASSRGQQAQLRQQVEGDVQGALSECLASCEAGMASLQQRLDRQTAAADSRQAELAGQAGQLEAAMQRLLTALRATVPSIPAAAAQVLLEGGGGSCSNVASSRAEAAAQEVSRAVREHVEQAEAAAIDSALTAVESELPASTDASPQPGSQPATPIRLLSPRKRQNQQQRDYAAAAAAAAAVQRAPSLEYCEGRLAALLARCQELLARVAAGDTQAATLQQRVAALEASLSGCQEQLKQVLNRTGLVGG